MLNTEFFNLLTEGPADDIRCFLLRLAFDEYEIIAIIQIGTVLIDAFGIIGNQAVLLLTENLIQDCYRNPPAAYQLPEYIPGANALQLINISYKNDLRAKSDALEKLPCQPHINHRAFVYDDEARVQRLLILIPYITVFPEQP